MKRSEIEREARAFLEQCRGDGQIDPVTFEGIVEREVALTIRQRRACGLEVDVEVVIEALEHAAERRDGVGREEG